MIKKLIFFIIFSLFFYKNKENFNFALLKNRHKINIKYIQILVSIVNRGI